MRRCNVLILKAPLGSIIRAIFYLFISLLFIIIASNDEPAGKFFLSVEILKKRNEETLI